MQVCVLLCAMVVLPLDLAVAQDFDAVERRLGQGVAEGELTLKQAAAMMDALRKATGEAKDKDNRGHDKADRDRDKGGRAKVDAYLRAAWGKLEAAVKAGKMSKEDAHKKMGEIKRELLFKLKNRDGRGPQSKAAPETPVLRWGVSPQKASVPRYQNTDYRRASAIQPLREIVDLPTALADDLAILARRASAAAKVVPNVCTEGYHVKYYSGVNHPHHGLLEHGVTEFSSRPSAGVYFTEHCFDQDGKLVKAIANRKDGTRFVSRTFLYEGDLPSGMLTFGPNGYSFADVGLYKKGRLCLVARIDPDGNIMFCESVFHTGDREDYSVRYVASRRSAQFTVSDLHVDALSLKGSSRLKFNESGELTAVFHYYPPKAP